MDYGHHAFNLLGRDGPCARLLPQQVHYMVGEFTAGLGRRKKKDRKELSAIAKRWDEVRVTERYRLG